MTTPSFAEYHRPADEWSSGSAEARKIFNGQRGDMMQPYRAGHEDPLGALGLVLNA
jgi:hypothetical protein